MGGTSDVKNVVRDFWGWAGVVLLAVLVVARAILWWRGYFGRRRVWKAVRTMAEPGSAAIDGQSVEHWLNILNDERTQPITASSPAVLLTHRGEQYLFFEGSVDCQRAKGVTTTQSFFLIAIGRPAARVLANDDRTFRRIAGNDEVTAFSVYRWGDFVRLLTAERGRSR